jgi:putative hydrolase of the HAD superfamily
MLSAALFDLDGVLLHFPSARLERIAATHGLQPTALTGAAFAPDVLERVVTGRLSHADWVVEVGEAVGSVPAVTEWLDGTAEVDRDALALVDDLKRAGLRVGLLTNGTDRTLDLIAGSGIPEAMDAVVCTALVGVAKPDAGAYAAAVAALEVEPGSTFFVDDTPRNVTGARQAGLHAALYSGVEALRATLTDYGALPLALSEAPLAIHRVTPDDTDAVERVARRMRLTLEEVVGPAQGGSMYTDDWLMDRAMQHLDGRHDGAIHEAWVEEHCVGHTIVRVVHDEAGPHGLFSTTWVGPGARRRGVASALLDAGETWMRERGLNRAATHTATDHAPLVALYEGRGYAEVLRADGMVRLEATLTA